MKLLYLVNLTFFLCVLSQEDTEVGSHLGYLSNCPGVTKEAVITEKSLKHLGITVFGPKNTFQSKKRYGFKQMKELARDPKINFKRKTLLYIPGYLDSPAFIFSPVIASAYTKRRYNVLSVDIHYFMNTQFPVAARLVRPLGPLIASMIVDLTKEGLDLDKLEVVGISLGAQVMSFVAKSFANMTGTKFKRASGLDPTGVCFRDLGPEDRLDKTDVDFLDIVYTNIDGYGMAAPIGHVNFYVNGGEYQQSILIPILCTLFCSHVRSFLIWVTAVYHPKSFIGIQCDSVADARIGNCFDGPKETNILGINVDKNKQGIFYLATKNTFPYYLEEKGLVKGADSLTQYLLDINKDDVLQFK